MLINGLSIADIHAGNFDETAFAIFRHQYAHNLIYRQFADAIRVLPDDVKTLEQIPFLPISFFKTHRVATGNWHMPALTFESSGTTGEIPSKHFVYDAGIYNDALLQGFKQFYGAPEQYAIIGLLPSYLERKNASLVHMAQTLMKKSGHPDCGFYLNEWEKLHRVLQRLEAEGQPVLLIGVTFALLDFAEAYPMPLHHTIVMETGGMKGRREEWTRPQVHDYLKKQWQLPNIHSEYGMTELLSQAYSKNSGIFETTATMKVLVRDINDPLEVKKQGNGCMNIIDLANIYSCSFIATDDLGNIAPNGTFEVLGRMDNAALRGCSLMVI